MKPRLYFSMGRWYMYNRYIAGNSAHRAAMRWIIDRNAALRQGGKHVVH